MKLIRPYDFILEPDSLFEPDEDQPRPFRVVSPDEESRSVGVEDGRLTLVANQSARPALTDPHGSFGGQTLAGGVAVWGNTIFLAQPDRHRVLYWNPCWDAPRPIPGVRPPPEPSAGDDCDPPLPHVPGPRELHTPVGLAISARDDLVIADREHRRLVLLALPGFVLRRVIGPLRAPGECAGRAMPERDPWAPVDVTPGPGGALYVADENGFIWQLDSQARPNPCYGGILPDGVIPARIVADAAGRVYVLPRPKDDGSQMGILVLDPFGYVMAAPLPDDAPPGTEPPPLELTSLDDRVDPTDPEAPRLRDVLPPSRLLLDGREILLAPDPCDAQPRSNRVPQPTGLMVDDSGHLVMDPAPGPYTIFVPPQQTFQRSGALILELDSRRFGNHWHRVALEFEPVERTGIRLYALTSEQPLTDISADELGGAEWTASQPNAPEWLFQTPPGRYLYLGIELIGPGDRTPKLGRLYVYRERHSSLNMLPATFQADETSRSVLDRLLSLFDTIYAEIDTTIDEFAFLLDVNSVTPDFLPWLASWFGLMLEQTWTDAQKRAFLRNIRDLYRWRGTVKGIARLVELHTQVKNPRVVEHYRAMHDTRLKEWLEVPGTNPKGRDEPAHHFTVLLPDFALSDDEKVAALRRLLDAYIPAHTHYTLRRLPAHGFRLAQPGMMLGLDTVIGSLPEWQLSPGTDPARLLGIGTRLATEPQPRAAIQVGGTRLRRPKHFACSPCADYQER